MHTFLRASPLMTAKLTPEWTSLRLCSQSLAWPSLAIWVWHRLSSINISISIIMSLSMGVDDILSSPPPIRQFLNSSCDCYFSFLWCSILSECIKATRWNIPSFSFGFILYTKCFGSTVIFAQEIIIHKQLSLLRQLPCSFPNCSNLLQSSVLIMMMIVLQWLFKALVPEQFFFADWIQVDLQTPGILLWLRNIIMLTAVILLLSCKATQHASRKTKCMMRGCIEEEYSWS